MTPRLQSILLLLLSVSLLPAATPLEELEDLIKTPRVDLNRAYQLVHQAGQPGAQLIADTIASSNNRDARKGMEVLLLAFRYDRTESSEALVATMLPPCKRQLGSGPDFVRAFIYFPANKRIQGQVAILMSCCIKKMKSFRVTIPDEHHKNVNFTQENLPGIMVLNKALQNSKPKEDFSWHLWVMLNLEDLIDNGMTVKRLPQYSKQSPINTILHLSPANP